MPPASVSAEEFLRAIWGEGPGIAELTSIGPKGVKSFPFSYPDSLQSLVGAIPNHNKDSNVYMGVVLRGEKWPRNTGRVDSQGKQIVEYRGTEDNALSSNLAGWFEIDFTGLGHKGKTITAEEAKKRLKEFPLKPSIIIKSGGGIQGYFLSKEPVSGNDLWRLKAINKALAIYLGADPQSVDLARILRVPGTINVKYTPPRPCEISWWHPECRYTLDDFDFLPIEDPQKPGLPAGASGPASSGTAGSTNPVLPNTPSASSRPNPKPEKDLDEEVVTKVGDLLGDIWVSGMRHQMALCIAGMLVNRGVRLPSAREVVARASNKAGGETDKRLKDVDSTYEKWYRNEKVTGVTELEAIIKEHTPAAYIDKSLAVLEKVKKLLPKPSAPGNGSGNGGDEDEAEPNFEIIPPLIKFDSTPARWTVTLKILDSDRVKSATVETQVFLKFQLFVEAFYEQTHELLMPIKNPRWLGIIRPVPIEVRETPKEAKPEGAIELALEEFFDTAQENPEEEGLLRAFPGRDEEGQFFKYHALDIFLKNRGERFERRVVLHHLKALGYAQKAKRIGPKPVKVWWRKYAGGDGPSNGNGHGGNGHPPSNGTPPPSNGAPVTAAAPAPPTVQDIFGDVGEDLTADLPSEPGENG